MLPILPLDVMPTLGAMKLEWGKYKRVGYIPPGQGSNSFTHYGKNEVLTFPTV